MLKRLFIALILLCFAVPCLAGTITIGKKKSGGGTTVFCTAAATCTATNPDQCDVLCEDFESSTSCYAAYDSVCYNTSAGLIVGAGDSIDFTTTTATSFCTGTTNTNVTRIIISSGGNESSIRYTKGGDDVWVQGYFNLVSESFGNEGGGYFLPLKDASSNLNIALQYYQHTDGKIYIRARYINDAAGTTYVMGTTALSVATWYRIRLAVNNSGKTATVKVNAGEAEISIIDLNTTNVTGRVYVGDNVGGSAAFTFEYDNLTIDATGEPGPCL